MCMEITKLQNMFTKSVHISVAQKQTIDSTGSSALCVIIQQPADWAWLHQRKQAGLELSQQSGCPMASDRTVPKLVSVREKNKTFYLSLSIYCAESQLYDWI